MKNIFLPLFILTTSTLKVAGQNNLIGVKCGANSTNITSSNFSSQNDSRTGLTTGLTYEFLIKKHFSIGADLIYNQRGFTTITNSNYFANSKIRHNGMTLNLGLKYTLTKD